MKHSALLAVPTTGVARVSTLARQSRGRGRMRATTSVQTALDFDQAEEPPLRPQLRLVTHDETRIDRMATRFAQAVVEVVGGDRSAFQLMRWTTPDVYQEVSRRCSVLNQVPAPRSRRARAQVRSVHLSVPWPGVAELSIHVRHGSRSRAIAARLEVIEGRWRCSALEFG